MRVGLVGYGKMGRGIFSVLSDAEVPATIFVRDPAKADDHNRKLEKRLQRAARGGAFPESELPLRLAQYRFTTDLADLRDCGVVVESVTEDWELKVSLLRRLEEILPADAILSTNSSSFAPSKLAESLTRPDRFCGFHFFHPVQLTTIIEIIVAHQTSPATTDAIVALTKQMRRVPIVVKDYSGSAINVMLTGHTCEALYILEQGAALPSRVDLLASHFARLGPCDALDSIGIDFFTHVLERTLEAFPFKLTVPELLRKLIADGRDGKYVGKGIFNYPEDRPADADPAYYIIPGQTHSPLNSPTDDDSLVERLLVQVYYYILYLAALEIGSLPDLCLGIQDLIGLKVDPWLYLRQLGSKGVIATLTRLQTQFGDRFDPTPVLPALKMLDAAGPPV